MNILTDIKLRSKKLISLLLAFSLLLSLFGIIPITAYAAVDTTFVEDGFTYKVTSDTTVEVSSFDNSTAEVTIPETVSHNNVDYTVTTLNSSNFNNNTVIKSIVIPGTIKTIPGYFFFNSSVCESITLNEGVEQIISLAFRNCTGLKTVHIPNSVKRIYTTAFMGCTSLEDIYCYSTNDNIKIDNAAFPSNVNFKFHCYEGTNAHKFAQKQGFTIDLMTPPETTTTTAPETTAPPVEMKEGAFTFVVTGDNTVQLKAFDKSTNNVVIPDKVEYNGAEYTVTDIASSVFTQNKSITSVNIPGTIEEVPLGEFGFCSSLKTLILNEGTKTIGVGAFRNCALEKVELPKSITTVENSAFTGNAIVDFIINSDATIELCNFGMPTMRNIYCYSDNVSLDSKVFYNVISDKAPINTKRITIYGNIGSAANTFANENGITFKTLEGEIVTNPAATTVAPETTEETEATSVVAETTEPVETTAAPATTAAAEPTEATTAAPETTAPGGTTVEVLLGDADGSGKVDVKDVTHIQKHIASYFTLEGTAALAADVDGNGTIDVNDATLVQKYLAAYNVDYKIGEVVQLGSDTPAPTADNPQPTEEQKPTEEATTTAVPETTGSAEPATTVPEPTHSIDDGTFYIPNYVGWLDSDGGKMWIYNNVTEKAIPAENYEKNADGLCGYFYFKNNLPDDWSEWTNISIYRTPYDITETTFDINSKWDEASKSGCILNSWVNIGDKGTMNAYRITSDTPPAGQFETFDPNAKPEIGERTIYFDNSKTKWTSVYVYGWNFGLNKEWVLMDQLMDENGNDLDIWSYTFTDWKSSYEGSEGFLFVNKNVWSGQSQTVNVKTESGKNLFVPSSSSGTSINGTWDVYTP